MTQSGRWYTSDYDMTSSQNIPWKRIAVEAVAIVGSILLAFAIDAWWDDRQTQIDEQQILLGLRAEFTANHEILSEDLTANLQDVESLLGLLSLIEGGESDDISSIALAAMDEMQSPKTTDLGSGTLNALMSSGRLEILRSRKLRIQLANWNGVIGEVSDDQYNLAKLVFEIYVPYFVREDYSRYAIDRSSGESADAQRLLEDRRFHNLLYTRIGFKEHLTGELEKAIAAAEQILAEIEVSIE